MIVTTPDPTITQILNSYILHSATLPSAGGNGHQEKIKHLHYLNDFRTQQCPLFLDHKCQVHRPFACFYWHFPNQRRRRPVKKGDGTFNYNPDVYCTTYDENTGVCPNGDECQYVHRNAGDTERRYHPRYYKTGQCIYETAENGTCVKNGLHCAFAHGVDDLRQPVYDIREISDAAEHIANLPATLEKERVLSEDPKWNDMLYVLAFYKTQMCKKPPRMCRQGYACPYYHNGKDRRRNPHSFRYRSTPCPQVKPSGDDWKDSSNCEAQDDCAYCHTRTEQQFHPEIYKSTKCNDMVHDGFCPRGPFCAFAHSESEANIGRDFLSNSNLIEDLNKEYGETRPTRSKSDDAVYSDPNSAQSLLFNASVTSSQLGLGMVGLSALSNGTIHYLQSLLSVQSQILQQYSSKQSQSLPPSSTPTQLPSSVPFKLNSACSSDSGLSTTREDLPPSAFTIEQSISPDKEGDDLRLDREERFPDINMIIGHVLGESFNCSLNEVNSLPDRTNIAETCVFDEKFSPGCVLSGSNIYQQENHAEEEDICTELGQQFSSISAPLSIPVNKNYRSNFQSDFSSRTWSSQPQSMGSPGGSSGFGDSVPFSHNRFMDQNCRGTSACSPASRMPQSPIMIQSPFNNAACDLEKLVMEKELNDVKCKLTETQKELSHMKHQRDVVLLQLQESWKLIQSLVNSEGLAGGEGKENLQIINELSRLSMKSHSSTSSSPEQTSLQSSQSTCTLTD